MKTHIVSLQQGSKEWHEHRASHLNASDCSAAMGMSPYKTRSQLLHEKATGITPEIDAQTQRRFDRGHEFEAIARSWAEEIINDELYPAVFAGEFEGLNLSASLDGLTMNGISFEHKTGHSDLLASLEQGIIPAEYHPQMEQGLMLSGAKRCLFIASNGDRETMRFAWYESDPELRAKIIPTWKQFEADVLAYVPTDASIAPVASAVAALPSVHVQVSGALAIRENFPAFEVALRDFLDNRLIRTPATDQDFADLELQIKVLKQAESELEAAEVQILSQVESVGSAKRMKDMLHKLTHDNRLMAEKLLKARKEQIRREIAQDGQKAYSAHVEALNRRLGRALMPDLRRDWEGAIKGRKTLASLRGGISDELARAKMAASEVADRIHANLAAIARHPDHGFLFPDVATLVLKQPEDLEAVLNNRISVHQAKEAARLAAERERIAEQERVKAQAEERLRAEAQIAAAAALVRADALEQARIEAQQALDLAKTAAPVAAPLTTAPDLPAYAAAAAPPAPATAPTLKLGDIGRRLGFDLPAAFIASLGFEPAARIKAAMLFHEADFARICAALIDHIERVMDEQETAGAV